LSDVGFVPPSFVATGLIIGLSILAIALAVTMRWRRQLEGWKPIPDVGQ
jgi:multisubunit Na+/H+ antiporter MnhC subunit